MGIENVEQGIKRLLVVNTFDHISLILFLTQQLNGVGAGRLPHPRKDRTRILMV